MAHTQACGVFRVTATEDIGSIKQVRRIVIEPSGSAVVILQDEDDTGNQVYEYTGTARVAESVEIQASQGLRVEVTNAVVYLYT